MSNSDETLNQEPTLKDVLTAISMLSGKIDGLEKKIDGHDDQFEAIRQGIVDNSVRFDRLDARMFEMRSDISNLKADMKELTEEIRHNRKVLV